MTGSMVRVRVRAASNACSCATSAVSLSGCQSSFLDDTPSPCSVEGAPSLSVCDASFVLLHADYVEVGEQPRVSLSNNSNSHMIRGMGSTEKAMSLLRLALALPSSPLTSLALQTTGNPTAATSGRRSAPQTSSGIDSPSVRHSQRLILSLILTSSIQIEPHPNTTTLHIIDYFASSTLTPMLYASVTDDLPNPNPV